MTSIQVGGIRVGPRGSVLIGVVAVVIVALVVWSAVVGRASGDSSEALGSAGFHSAVASGATVRVLSVDVGVAATSVELVVEDRLDLGANVVLGGLATVTDSGGEEHFLRTSQADARTLRLGFSGGASMAPGVAALSLPALWLTDGTVEDGTMPPPEKSDALELRLDIPDMSGASLRVPLSAGGPLGPGFARVDSMSRDSSSLLVNGVFEGFTREQVQAMGVRAWVILEDGTELAMAGGRLGFGDHLEGFEYWFNVSNTIVVTHVEFRLEADRIPEPLQGLGPEVDAALDQLKAASGAILRVPLPRLALGRSQYQ